FTGYYDDKEHATNHLRAVICDEGFQNFHSNEIKNILIFALNDWYNDVRNYESANNGYCSAKNEAALALKQQLDDFYNTFA
ncbi:MAG: hypothetical protein KDI39_09435, partial [Pseudomonadales bacterium]|nr:hypothetical protein [Pseudomonadales bacterium]